MLVVVPDTTSDIEVIVVVPGGSGKLPVQDSVLLHIEPVKGPADVGEVWLTVRPHPLCATAYV